MTSVNYIDRVLKIMNVERKKLQLVGCACMLIASKYEEIYAPSVDDFVYISDNTYTNKQVLEMEHKCLTVLDFKLTVSTLQTFLPRYIRAVSEDATSAPTYSAVQKYLAKYMADLSLVEYETRDYRPSVIAAACLDLARRIVGIGDHWTASLEKYSGITEKELIPAVRLLAKYHRKASKGGGGGNLKVRSPPHEEMPDQGRMYPSPAAAAPVCLSSFCSVCMRKTTARLTHPILPMSIHPGRLREVLSGQIHVGGEDFRRVERWGHPRSGLSSEAAVAAATRLCSDKFYALPPPVPTPTPSSVRGQTGRQAKARV